MVETFPRIRLYFLGLAVLFVTCGLQPTVANNGCPVVRLSGEYNHQRRQMTTYSITDQDSGNRPVYASDTTNNYLYYLDSIEAWLVGSTLGEDYAYLLARDNATSPELITQGTFEVSSGSQFVLAPNLRVSCSGPGYIGCYHYLYISGRRRQWTGSNITIDNCKLSCRSGNFPYTALYGHQCWCATHITSDATRASLPYCDRPCDGNPLQFCGGRNNRGYTEVHETITDCGPVPVTPGVTSVRPSQANITVGQTAEVDCWNGTTVTLTCLQNGSFNRASPFCPEPTTVIMETSEGSTTVSPDLRNDGRSGDRSINIIPVVGGLVAGLIFIVIVAVAAFFLVRKRNAGLAQETPVSSQRGTNLDNSTYHEPVMTSEVVLTDTGAQYQPTTSAENPRATDAEPQYSTIPEYSTIDEMERKGGKAPQTKNNTLDQLYSKPAKKAKNNSEEGMVDNILYGSPDDVIDGEGAMDSNGRYVDNDLYG